MKTKMGRLMIFIQDQRAVTVCITLAKKIYSYKSLKLGFLWYSSKNTINIARRHFKLLIQNKVNLIRIALHPRDPVHTLNDQKVMITQLKNQGYEILRILFLNCE